MLISYSAYSHDVLCTPRLQMHPFGPKAFHHNLRVTDSFSAEEDTMLPKHTATQYFVQMNRSCAIPFLVTEASKDVFHTLHKIVSYRYLQELKYNISTMGITDSSPSHHLLSWMNGSSYVPCFACLVSTTLTSSVLTHPSVLMHFKTLISFSLRFSWCGIIPASDIPNFDKLPGILKSNSLQQASNFRM